MSPAFGPCGIFAELELDEDDGEVDDGVDVDDAEAGADEACDEEPPPQPAAISASATSPNAGRPRMDLGIACMINNPP
jgi:hypothetical protein